VEVLDVTAVGLLLAQSTFLAPAFMMAVIEGAEVMRSWTARRARQAGLDLLLSQHRRVLVEHDGQQERVEVAALVPGDIVLVDGGDQIPVDGAVLDGKALVDRHRVTGDAAPTTVSRGDFVHAASVVIEGHLRIEASRTGLDTQAAGAIDSIDAAPKPDTRSSNWARKTGNWGVAPNLVIAGVLWATSNSIGRAAGIVALDFGLGMRVSAPVAILTAQSNAARNGILIRSGRAVEMLG
jgi:Cu2+-exporting ATPase